MIINFKDIMYETLVMESAELIKEGRKCYCWCRKNFITEY